MEHLEEVIEEIRTFVTEREWARFHDPKNLAMALASECGELLSELRWVGNADSDAFASSPERRPAIAAEVGDVGITLVLLCDRLGLDLVRAMRDKLEVNRRNYPAESSRGKSERPNR